MRFKSIFQTLLFSFSLLFFQQAQAQTLDSKVLIKELENSNNKIFEEFLARYDVYLKQHPADIKILIEKCKFLQNAQFDEQEEVNPNQELFDSCSAALETLYPDHPDVLIFQTTYKWDDDLSDVFDAAQASIQKNPDAWSAENLGLLYKSMSDKSFFDDDYEQAYTHLFKAISHDPKYKTNIVHAQILMHLKKNEEALKVLLTVRDNPDEIWTMIQKADMLLEMKAYSKAIKLYNKITEIDSTYNNNFKIASSLEKVGQIELARQCLVADTAKSWDKEEAIRNLFLHDLKFQPGEKCIESYNDYRDFGYYTDPLGFFRLKIFFSHPLQPWAFRDILGLLSFILLILILLLIPSIWILPFYFVGHKWNFLSREKPFGSDWGLKSFWFVSFGFLFASLMVFFVQPELLSFAFSSSYFNSEFSPENSGIASMVFILVFALFGFATLYKTNLKVLLSTHWSIKKSILLSIGIFVAYRIIAGIYERIGLSFFDVSMEDIAGIQQLFLMSRSEIEALVAFSGKGIAFLLICLLVPLYEEIVFRGVILGACQKYTNFHIANFFQATLFATIHQNLFLFPVLLLFGIIAGHLRRKSGGLLPGIVFHVINNLLALSVLLFK